VTAALKRQGVAARECRVHDSRRNIADRIVVRGLRRIRSGPLHRAARTVVRAHLTAAQRRLLGAAAEWKPDLVLVLAEEWALAGTLREIRRRAGGAILAVWATDDPLAKERFTEALPLYDFVFCFDSFYVPALAGLCSGRVLELPFGCDPRVFRPIRMTDAERSAHGSDIAFIGAWRPERGAHLEAIADLDLGIWGWGRSRRPAVPAALAGRLRAGSITNQQANVVHNASRIVVGVHPERARNTIMRGFEAAASGAFPLIAEKPDLSRFFVPGEEVITFRTPEDLRARAVEFLADPERRVQIARRARARALASHTYDHRVAALLEAVGFSPGRDPAKPDPAPPVDVAP
jgi:spore maturation protein CgeB